MTPETEKIFFVRVRVNVKPLTSNEQNNYLRDDPGTSFWGEADEV